MCELFRHRPDLAAELLSGTLGLPLPDWHEARLRSENVTDDRLAELRSDVVVEYWRVARGFAVIVEVQLSDDDTKHFSWPFYLSGLRYRLRCPVILLVVCPTEKVAAWAAGTIDLGHPGSTLTPIVLGPDRIPQIMESEHARRCPELAVLSALAHGGRPDATMVLNALLDAYGELDIDHRTLYHDVVCTALPETARLYLETTMRLKGYEYQSEALRKSFGDGKAEGRAEGKAEGEIAGAAKMILRVLAGRGICASADVRDRITSCTDLPQLETWLDRAIVATTARQLFDDPIG